MLVLGESMDMLVLFFVDFFMDEECCMDDVMFFIFFYIFFEIDGVVFVFSDVVF